MRARRLLSAAVALFERIACIDRTRSWHRYHLALYTVLALTAMTLALVWITGQHLCISSDPCS